MASRVRTTIRSGGIFEFADVAGPVIGHEPRDDLVEITGSGT